MNWKFWQKPSRPAEPRITLELARVLIKERLRTRGVVPTDKIVGAILEDIGPDKYSHTGLDSRLAMIIEKHRSA